MCYHKQNRATQGSLEQRYKATIRENYQPNFHENGFSHLPSPVITSENTSLFRNLSWGLVPFWVKSREDAMQIRNRTLNAISEEAFEKPSFRDSIRKRRCIVPCTGFFEWRWGDSAGKIKYPYFIRTTEEIFSLAGIWSEWEDRESGTTLGTYSVLTTRANPMMEKIHNSKKRMPVILPREYEADWLNPDLTREDVLALCAPFDQKKMEAWTISRRITDRTSPKNTEEIMQAVTYPELEK
jgi:putative SOS response-associated peptidase YedK